ncbi:hypothetical protein EDC01DRAFT_614515 [Geopyxis carbonaria]|nr:hypothetical protein EDC01DRAFT_614515 [Geopyxis carbonaria]
MFSLTSLSTILVALRIYCRAIIIRSVTADDYLILLALLNTWGLCISNYFHVHYGTGKHAADITDYTTILIPTLKLWYAYQLQYLIILFFTKASILAFYWRLSRQRSYRLAIVAVAATVAVYTAALLLVNIFECPADVSRAWHPSFPRGCNNLVAVYYGMAAFNIISDVVILLLPLPTVLALQVNRRKRAALLLVFSCGAIAVVASVVRINALVRYQHAVTSGGDIPYVAAYILLWSQVEVNAAISTASAPALKPLVRSVLGGSTWGKSYGVAGGAYGRSGRSGGQGYGREMESFHTHGGGGVTSTAAGGGSTENIIQTPQGGIVRTTDVKVDVEVDVDGQSRRRGPNDSDESLRRLEFGA